MCLAVMGSICPNEGVQTSIIASASVHPLMATRSPFLSRAPCHPAPFSCHVFSSIDYFQGFQLSSLSFTGLNWNSFEKKNQISPIFTWKRWGLMGTSYFWRDSNCVQEENFSQWKQPDIGNNLLREAMDSPTLENFKIHWDMVLGHLV